MRCHILIVRIYTTEDIAVLIIVGITKYNPKSRLQVTIQNECSILEKSSF